ncbi:hypothetical protein [Streptosporangium canum]|uniref:hypothetical protein n=1 Tax=Streptosporangium canum TaxID=324952 RepID=UPI00379AB145
MDDADGDLDAGGDGADGFPALAAGQDRGAFVVVDHGSAATDPAAAGRLQAVLGLADDVAAPVFGQGQDKARTRTRARSRSRSRIRERSVCSPAAMP